MNIVYITSQPYPIGMAGTKRIRMLAEPLAASHNVEVLILGSPVNGNALLGEYNGVKYKHESFSRIGLLLSFLKARKILEGRFQKGQYNALIFYDGIGLKKLWFCIIGKKIGYFTFADVVEDYSVHQENTGLALSLLHKIDFQIEKSYPKLLNGIAVISSGLYNKFLNSGIPRERIVQIPICAENYALKLKPSVKTDTNVRFVYSGSFGVKDGVEILIDAFEKVRVNYSNVELVLSGKINNTISERIKGSERITYVGMIPDEDFYQFLQDADVLMMTRIDSAYANAGFPFKLGEYMATGNPVIATTVSDIATFLENKRDAILVEPSSVSSLLQGMEYFLENRQECKEMGLRGKQKGATLFSPRLNGEKLERFLVKTAEHETNLA